MSQTVGIIGLGLIGGSIALALRHSHNWNVVGFDASVDTTRMAAEQAILSEMMPDVRSLAEKSDVVVVAVPCSAIPEVALEAANSMKPGSILTDVGSAKHCIEQQILEGLPSQVSYIGGHPMAGRDTAGLEHASCDMFRGAVWALTLGNASEEKLETVCSLVRETGARPLIVNSSKHDEAVSFSSHLPYVVSAALAMSFEQASCELPLVQQLAATGLRDTTRLARSDLRVAPDYCAMNAVNLLSAIEVFEQHLCRLKNTLAANQPHEMAQSISGARQFLLHNFPAATADEKEAYATMVRGVRGATSIESNEPAQILEKTQELVREVMRRNAIMPDDIALLQFILTHDIDAVFPARAARELGLNTVPLIDTLSPDVQNAEPGIIRLVLLWNTNKRQREISHVYLGRAGRLRPDLVAGRDTGRSSL